jgi:hypothetical protein
MNDLVIRAELLCHFDADGCDRFEALANVSECLDSPALAHLV